MSQTAIGKAALVLSTNTAEVKPGLVKTEVETKSWSKRVAGYLSSTFGKGTLGGLSNIGGQISGKLTSLAASAKSGLTVAGTAIGTALGGPIGAAIGGAVGSSLGDIGVTIAGAIGAPFEKLNQFGKIVKQAGSLGIDASQYQGLSQVLATAGIEGDQVNATLVTMSKLVNDAANGYGNGFGKASAAFEQLGIDAQVLAAQKPDEQFKTIASALVQVKNPAEQAAIAAHIFGGRAAEILPVLQRGGKGIQDFIDNQKRFGAVLSTEQLKAAADASKAWGAAKRAISTAWDGLANRATLIAAPLIKFAANAVTKLFGFVAPVFEWVGRGVSKVGDVLGVLFDALGGWIGKAIDWVKGLGSEFFGFAGGLPTIEDVVVGVFKGIGIAVAYVWDTVKAGAGVVAVVFGKVIEVVADVTKRLLDLAKAVPAEFRPDWFNGFLANADAGADRAARFGKEIGAWGSQAVNSWGQSAGQFSTWLDAALAKQKGATAEAAAAAGEAAGQVTAELKKLDNAALLKGSSAEVSARLRHEFGGSDPQKALLEQQRQANRHLGGIETGIGDLVTKVGTGALLSI